MAGSCVRFSCLRRMSSLMKESIFDILVEDFIYYSREMNGE